MSSQTVVSLQLVHTQRMITMAASRYEELPDAIRAIYTEKEWLWLSDAEKATLVQRETEPEVE